VELVHGLGRGAREGDDVLARVVAFGGAGPEEETAVECCGMICKSNMLAKVYGKHTYGRGRIANAIGGRADLQTVVEFMGSVADGCVREAAQQAEGSKGGPC
jgi:hypothetical protein